MRLLLLALLMVAGPVAAQGIPGLPPPGGVPGQPPMSRPPRSDVPRGGPGASGQARRPVSVPHILLSIGSYAGLVYAADHTNGLDGDGPSLVMLLMPVAAGGLTCLMGDILKEPGSCPGALIGGLAAAVPGALLMGGALATGDSLEDLGLYLVGGILYLAGPPIGALIGYRISDRVQPAVALTRTPEGALVPVAALSVRW